MTRQHPLRVSHYWIRLGRALQVFFIWRCFVLIGSPHCVTHSYLPDPTHCEDGAIPSSMPQLTKATAALCRAGKAHPCLFF